MYALRIPEYAYLSSDGAFSPLISLIPAQLTGFPWAMWSAIGSF